MTELERRIIDISYKHRLSHLGSCLTAVSIIDRIFRVKKSEEKFVLSSGHAGLALYVVLESRGLCDAEDLLQKCGVHPDRLAAPGVIDCSTGSLGLGICIALGMALADRNQDVYCLVSDGECAEGSVAEALHNRYKFKADNLIAHCNFNGYGAYGKSLMDWSADLRVTDTCGHWFMKKYGQSAHYITLDADMYEEIICQ